VIGKDLAIPDAMMSLTVTVYFMAFSIFIFLTGPFSDAFGRRSLIIIGAVVFIIGSLLCGMAHSAGGILAGRTIQAIGASMIPGTARAMIRDVGSDTQVVSLMGWMAVLGGLMMVAAPIMGGVITESFSWRYNFWFLVAFSVIVVIVIAVKLPETLPPLKRIKLHPGVVFKAYGRMLISPRFILVVMPIVICFAVQGAYLAAAPFIFIKGFKLTPTEFGLTNISIVTALLGGRYLSVYSTKKYSPPAAYVIGSAIVILSGVLFVLIAIFKVYSIHAVLTAISLFGLGFGVLSPVGMKSSITAFRETSGMAAALQGCLVLGGTAVGSAGIAFILKVLPGVHPIETLAVWAAALTLFSFLTALIAQKRVI
jgi:DHA1 family bicyclomycin/chloramphenicol resistance-like MFS transporter